MVTKYKKQLEPLIAIIAEPFLSWNPSVLTLLSVVSSVIFFAGIVKHLYALSLIGIVGFIFDALDGYVARKTGKSSRFGAFLDSSGDRVSDFFMITAFGFGHLVGWELVILVMGTTFLISYIRARAEAVFAAEKLSGNGLMQRTERIIFLLLTFLLYLLFPNLQIGSFSFPTIAFGVLFLLNIVTLFQRFWYFVHY